jgi:lysophospholipase L1-like esterase
MQKLRCNSSGSPKHIFLWIALALNLAVSAQLNTYKATHPDITKQGRTLPCAGGTVEMVSSASSVGFRFSGDSCVILLRNSSAPGDYNYIALEIDDTYSGRIRVGGDSIQQIVIMPTIKKAWHKLRVYKATEASNGVVAVKGVQAKGLKPLADKPEVKIEFIGNSITCGMGNDIQEIPCGGSSKWYDQHNAYWSYAAITGRAVGAAFMLSSISGAGIYRNWNSNGRTVPQQYEHAYLRMDSVRKWDFSAFVPDLVCIALGTNDLSPGDGSTPRLAFDSAVFVREYVNFLGTIYSHYPQARILLLSSPMVNGQRSEMLKECLQSVQRIASVRYAGKKKISVFNFGQVTSSGCTGHPTIAEHRLMSEMLIPYIKQVLKE